MTEVMIHSREGRMKTLLIILILSVGATTGFSKQSSAKKHEHVQALTVSVTKKGFRPSNLKLKANVPTRITFIRKTDESCATEVVIPEFSIDQKLPLNEPVVVEFTPAKTGEFKFACGMDMDRGKLIVKR
jgi:plastocyanin domain-containing protein